MAFDFITDTAVAALLGVPVDASLSRFTAAVQSDFAKDCGRRDEFERKERTVYAEGFGPRVDFVYVPIAPIWSLIEVRIDAAGAFTADPLDLSLFWFESKDTDFKIHYRGGWFPEGRRVAKLRLVGGYHPVTDTSSPAEEERVPTDLQDDLMEEVAVRYRRGGNEQFASVSVPGSESHARFKAGRTDAYMRAVQRYKRRN
jgi:hypothetical protein